MPNPLSLATSAAATFDWIWAQRWRDVLFLHWRVPSELLRPHVPTELDIDPFDGSSWASAVIFRLAVRPRGLPYFPLLSELVEVNLRTYVRHRGEPGVFFLSVHADNRFAIAAARLLTPLPYRWATLAYRRDGDVATFDSRLLRASGRVAAAAGETAPGFGTLDEFLLERYRLYALNRRGEMLRGDVRHPRWRTRPVDVTLDGNQFGDPFGLDLAAAPDATHFSAGVPALFGRFRPA